MKSQPGFSLIELITSMAIIAVLSGILILNFRSSSTTRAARIQVAEVIVSDIRRMQSMATAGSLYKKEISCGFGIHYLDKRNYVLFARPKEEGIPCSADIYNPVGDAMMETKIITNPNLVFQDDFDDIFFVPPHPTTYIGGLPDNPQEFIEITDTENLGGTTFITVFNSGRIDITDD